MIKIKLGILNTEILTCDGGFTMRTITVEEAKYLVQTHELDSAVGHWSTANILSELLGVAIPTNRQLFVQELDQKALVFKLNGRAPEGVILTTKELEEIGFTLKLLTRVA